jgi:DNA invertase Pin-like site-specific DNA recombinase
LEQNRQKVRLILRRLGARPPHFPRNSPCVRFLAGQAAARAAGKVWGGGKPGRRVRLSEEKEQVIKQLSRLGKGISEIARVVGLSRPTIYKAIG